MIPPVGGQLTKQSARFCASKVDDGYELAAIRRRLAVVAVKIVVIA